MKATDRFLPPARQWAALLALLLLGPTAVRAQPNLPPRQLPLAFEGYKVSDVKVEGTREVPAERVLNTVLTKPGSELSQSVLDEDVRKLYATNFFANVTPSVYPQPAQKTVEVRFVVTEMAGRIKDIVFVGAKHLSDEELGTLTGIRKGESMLPWRNHQAARAILDKYYDQGRPFAQVRLLEGAQPTDGRVVFEITEGRKVKITGIDFTGNTFVSGGVLRTHIRSSKQFIGLFGGKYNPIVADLDVTALEEYYKSFGYHDVQVARELQWENSESVRLIFHIQEGPRYRVAGRPQVDGVSGKYGDLPKEAIEALPRVTPGEFFSQAKVDADINSIKDYYGMLGHDVRVRQEVFHPANEPAVCQVHYRIEERPPAKVGLIYLVGNEVTKQNVILRQIPLYPGQVLTYPDLRVGERNLARLNIFEMNPETGARPTLEVLDREGDAEFKDILVRVQETRTGSLLFGVGVNSDNGFNGSVVLNERNFDICRVPESWEDFLSGRAFRGAGQELRLEAVPGNQAQRYSATFREPFLFDSEFSLTAGAYYYSRIYDGYTESRLGTRMGLGRRLNQHWTVTGGLRVENVGIHDVPWYAPSDFQEVVGDNFLAGLKAGVLRDSRDSFLRPTEGSLLDVSVEQVMGEFSFPLVNVDFNKYFTIYQRADGSGRHVLAMHNQFSWAGDDAPMFERYYAGGFRSMRGFQFRGIAPTVNGFKVGGDFMLLNSLEYQLPILASDRLFLVGFVDSGTVEDKLSINDYRVSAGVGVRFVVPGLGPVPIALDFGFPIVKNEADQEQLFSFWLGFFH